jgi:BMFP domain-containing protein YqiC
MLEHPMQTKNPIFDDIAEMMTGAAGAVASAGEEMRTVIRSRVDKMIADMDLVSREEFELVKEMAIKALADNEELRKELASLKAPVSKKTTGKKPVRRKPAKSSGVK